MPLDESQFCLQCEHLSRQFREAQLAHQQEVTRLLEDKRLLEMQLVAAKCGIYRAGGFDTRHLGEP